MNIKFLIEKTEQKEVYVIANSLNEAKELLKKEFPGFVVKEVCGNPDLSPDEEKELRGVVAEFYS